MTYERFEYERSAYEYMQLNMGGLYMSGCAYERFPCHMSGLHIMSGLYMSRCSYI